MFNVNKPLELPAQLHWRFAHEPELLGWTIKARNYNLFWANFMFILIFTITLIPAYFIYSLYDDLSLPWRLIPSVIPTVIVLPVSMTGSHRQVNIAYRFTHSGAEYCQWKVAPKWVLPVLKWLTIFVAILFLFLATVNPSFLLAALVGPGGMVLTYLSMAHNKNLQEIDTEYNHLTYEWKDFKAMTIATNREVVDLKYRRPVEKPDCSNTWSVNIYCQRKQKEHVAALLQQHLAPDTPILRAKADIW